MRILLNTHQITYAMHNPIIVIETMKTLIHWWARNKQRLHRTMSNFSLFYVQRIFALCFAWVHCTIFSVNCFFLVGSVCFLVNKIGYLCVSCLYRHNTKSIPLNFRSKIHKRIVWYCFYPLITLLHTQLNFSLNLLRFFTSPFVVLCSYTHSL